MTTVEILREARRLIEKPEAWTQGCMARDKRGNKVSCYYSKFAAAFCASGAIRRVCGDSLDAHNAEIALEAAARCVVLARWNDSKRRKHSQVLAAFDRAVKRAGGAA